MLPADAIEGPIEPAVHGAKAALAATGRDRGLFASTHLGTGAWSAPRTSSTRGSRPILVLKPDDMVTKGPFRGRERDRCVSECPRVARAPARTVASTSRLRRGSGSDRSAGS